jgi:hypothetical protein
MPQSGTHYKILSVMTTRKKLSYLLFLCVFLAQTAEASLPGPVPRVWGLDGAPVSWFYISMVISILIEGFIYKYQNLPAPFLSSGIANIVSLVLVDIFASLALSFLVVYSEWQPFGLPFYAIGIVLLYIVVEFFAIRWSVLLKADRRKKAKGIWKSILIANVVSSSLLVVLIIIKRP